MILKNVQCYCDEKVVCKDIEISDFDNAEKYNDLLCVKSFSAVVENNLIEEKLEDKVRLKKQFVSECIKNGITRIIDVSRDSLLSAKVYMDYDIDIFLAVKLFPDENIDEKVVDNKIAEIKRINNRASTILAFDSVFDFNEDQITEIVKYAKKHNMHIYTKISQSLDEVGECDKIYNMSPVEYLESLGILDRKCIIGGCEYLDKEDLELLQNYDCTLCLSVSDDLVKGVGFAPIYSMLNKGLKICVGLKDDVRPNIFREMFLLTHTQSAVLNIPNLIKPDAIISTIQRSIIDEDKADKDDFILIKNDYNTADNIGTKIVNNTNPNDIVLVVKNNKICYKK